MLSQEKIVERLNAALRYDWQAMSQLLSQRVPANAQMVEHPAIVMRPVQTPHGATYRFGVLGLLNGLLYDATPGDSPKIEACFTEEATPELYAFRLGADDEQATPDMRLLPLSAMVTGCGYRVTDRQNNIWQGVYAGAKTGNIEGVHLRLADGSLVVIYFHDVAKILRMNI